MDGTRPGTLYSSHDSFVNLRILYYSRAQNLDYKGAVSELVKEKVLRTFVHTYAWVRVPSAPFHFAPIFIA